ncbi:MAG: hypothetical protein QNJ58_02005 [Desulfobacterales bacterium]|nr:hypothetical protein [Desulfobacterales bacterium]
MNIAAIIPARLGSKRLKNKNISILGDKPLLFWSIDTALESDCFKYIVVSSESDQVLDLVRRGYSSKEVQTIKRPDRLATDKADLRDVCNHFLENFPDIEFLFLMMPTYPFRNARRINDEILPPLYSRQIDRVVSVIPSNFSTFDYWFKKGILYRKMFNRAPLWCGAGNATYSLMRRDYFFKTPQNWPYLPGERTLRIQTDNTESIDIDTTEDFRKAEKIVQGYEQKKRQLKSFCNKTHEIVLPEGAKPGSLLDFLASEGVNLNLPVLILTTPPPYFTFLRWYECNNARDYYSELTKGILADLPKGGHSQDFPEHYIHSISYRILRKREDREGIQDDCVSQKQIIFEEELKKWGGYIEPNYWVKTK